MADKEQSQLWALIQTWLDGQPFTVSQRQLAKKLDVSPTLLSHWKVGQSSPNPEALEKLAQVTNLPKSALIRALLLDQGYVADEVEAAEIVPNKRVRATAPMPRQAGA